ncbi:MAG: transcription elongation factor GreA [Phycisphaerales bacterium]
MEMMTREEKQTIEERLQFLINNRKAIATRIAEAREQGDLSENADYHAAREEQGLQEAEIRRLTDRLQNISVIDDAAAKSAGVVFVGAKVKIREVGSDEDEMVKLVGDSTSAGGGADYFEATVSSPMGEALLKARVGEVIAVRGPRGLKRFEIMEIL